MKANKSRSIERTACLVVSNDLISFMISDLVDTLQNLTQALWAKDNVQFITQKPGRKFYANTILSL